jgi:hypothetical protein
MENRRPHALRRVRHLRRVALALTVATLAWPAWAGSFAYVQASSQLDLDVNPVRYSPYNLLDRDPNSIWCEASPSLGDGQEVRFFFKGSQTVDRIAVTPAAASGRRLEVLRLSDGTSSIKLKVDEGPTETTLTTPLHGTVYVLSIEQVGAPATSSVFGDDVSCLAGFEMYHGDQLVTPGKPRPASDGVALRIVGSWASEPLGAPDSTLTFAIDGTWTWVHKPLMGNGKRKTLEGTYRIKGGHLQMRLGADGRFVDMGLKIRRTPVDPGDMGAPKGDYDVLTLGEGLGKELAGQYNNALF